MSSDVTITISVVTLFNVCVFVCLFVCSIDDSVSNSHSLQFSDRIQCRKRVLYFYQFWSPVRSDANVTMGVVTFIQCYFDRICYYTFTSIVPLACFFLFCF